MYYLSCFDGIYIDALLEIEWFGESVQTLSDLTDDMLKAKLETISGTTQSVSYDEALADVQRNVRLNPNETDAAL